MQVLKRGGQAWDRAKQEMDRICEEEPHQYMKMEAMIIAVGEDQVAVWNILRLRRA